MAEQAFPIHARVVIVGGGVMGAGLAYHLGHESRGANRPMIRKDCWHGPMP